MARTARRNTPDPNSPRPPREPVPDRDRRRPGDPTEPAPIPAAVRCHDADGVTVWLPAEDADDSPGPGDEVPGEAPSPERRRR